MSFDIPRSPPPSYSSLDVVRCRRNGLANAPFPLPILCPADGVEPVDGVLPDLGFVEGCCDARQSCLNLLPYGATDGQTHMTLYKNLSAAGPSHLQPQGFRV